MCDSIDSEEFILAMRLEQVRQLPLEERLLLDSTLVDLVPKYGYQHGYDQKIC